MKRQLDDFRAVFTIDPGEIAAWTETQDAL